MNWKQKLGTAGTVFILSSAVPTSAMASDWEWSAALYAWGAGIQTTTAVNGNEISDVDLSFSDILDKLDFTLMAHFEGMRDTWGFMADVNYLDISDREKTNGVRVDSDVASSIVDLAGVYRPSGMPEGIEAFAGLRYFNFDIGIDVTGPAGGTVSTSSDESYTDLLVGIRYTGPMSENWIYRVRADASGGDTEGSWSALASVGYQFGKAKDKTVMFGYRHMEIDIEDDQGAATVANDMTISGPVVAINFAF
jgi:hypothetical protein